MPPLTARQHRQLTGRERQQLTGREHRQQSPARKRGECAEVTLHRKPIQADRRWLPWLFPAAAGLLLAAFLLFRYPKIALSQPNGAKEHEYRKDALQVFVLLGGAVALIFAGHQAVLLRRGQIADRFIKAVTMLKKTREHDVPAIAARVGALLILKRIAQHSSEDREDVLGQIASYIREHASSDSPRRDILTALNILSELQPMFVRSAKRYAVNLEGANLSGYNLEKLDLRGFKLQNSILSGSILDDVDRSDRLQTL